MVTDVRKPWLALRGCWAELESGKVRPLSDAPLPTDLPQRHADALVQLLLEGG